MGVIACCRSDCGGTVVMLCAIAAGAERVSTQAMIVDVLSMTFSFVSMVEDNAARRRRLLCYFCS
jgi:hypothetical protein